MDQLPILAAASGAGSVAYNEDFDSMAMASIFALAVLSYPYGLYATSRSSV